MACIECCEAKDEWHACVFRRELEEREGGLKCIRGALKAAEDAVRNAHASMQRMSALDAAVTTLVAKSKKGVCHHQRVWSVYGGGYMRD